MTRSWRCSACRSSTRTTPCARCERPLRCQRHSPPSMASSKPVRACASSAESASTPARWSPATTRGTTLRRRRGRQRREAPRGGGGGERDPDRRARRTGSCATRSSSSRAGRACSGRRDRPRPRRGRRPGPRPRPCAQPTNARRKSSRYSSRSILRWIDGSMSRPSLSKKRISTVSGSPSRRTVMPPCDVPLRTWKRVSGTVASSRSSTLMPERLRPLINPRLRAHAETAGVTARADRGTLRQHGAVRHRQPCDDLGADVDVREPTHSAPAEQRPRARLSHTIDDVTIAPDSTVLNG